MARLFVLSDNNPKDPGEFLIGVFLLDLAKADSRTGWSGRASTSKPVKLERHAGAFRLARTTSPFAVSSGLFLSTKAVPFEKSRQLRRYLFWIAARIATLFGPNSMEHGVRAACIPRRTLNSEV